LRYGVTLHGIQFDSVPRLSSVISAVKIIN
jgi:hypothetical protein